MLNTNLDLEVAEGSFIRAQYSSVAGEHVSITFRDETSEGTTKSVLVIRLNLEQSKELEDQLLHANSVFEDAIFGS